MVWMGPTTKAESLLWGQVQVAEHKYEIARLEFLGKVGMALLAISWAASLAFIAIVVWLLIPAAIGAGLVLYGFIKGSVVQARR